MKINKILLIVGVFLSFVSAKDCGSSSNMTEAEILNVIKNGSDKYGCPMGMMPKDMAVGKSAKRIAIYVANGLKGKAPASYAACTSCHGADSKGNSGMSPDISHFGKVKNPTNISIKKDIAKCANKSTDANRLICYDGLAKKLGVDKPKQIVSVGKGKWVVSKETSAVDDSTNVTLYLEAKEMIRGKYTHEKIRPVIVLRCSENTTNAYINWDTYLGIDNIKVLTRIDKKKAIKRNWSISTGNKATFAPKNIAFIKSLFGHSKFLAELTPYGDNPKMATFDIAGLKEAIKPLRKECGW